MVFFYKSLTPICLWDFFRKTHEATEEYDEFHFQRICVFAPDFINCKAQLSGRALD